MNDIVPELTKHDILKELKRVAHDETLTIDNITDWGYKNDSLLLLEGEEIYYLSKLKIRCVVDKFFKPYFQ